MKLIPMFPRLVDAADPNTSESLYVEILGSYVKFLRSLSKTIRKKGMPKEGSPVYLIRQWPSLIRKMKGNKSFYSGAILKEVVSLISISNSIFEDDFSLHDIKDLIELMQGHGVVVGRAVYERAIVGLSSAIMPDRVALAVGYKAQFENKYGTPSPLMYKALLLCCRPIHDPEDKRITLRPFDRQWENLWNEIVQRELESTTTFEGLIRLLSKIPSKKHILNKYFNEMVKKNIPRNIYIYDALIESCIESKDFSKAVRYFSMLKEDKSNEIYPSEQTYRNLMQVANIGTQNLEIARQIYKSYFEEFDSHDPIISAQFVSSLLKAKNYGEMFEFLHKLHFENGMQITESFFQPIMSHFSNRDTFNAEMAKQTFDMMEHFKTGKDCRIYVKLCRAYLLSNDLDNALFYFNEMLSMERACKLYPSDKCAVAFIDILVALVNSSKPYASSLYKTILQLARCYYGHRTIHKHWINGLTKNGPSKRTSVQALNLPTLSNNYMFIDEEIFNLD
ncbi:hypothetical protein ROZALSC1DRAFT_30704 [Rozella allomycis CSF55]|uniref:Pentacotripeptide-repeat region of PRORP domain-containing protein n=1 Tax=Rozella allomycis (strain CSF55) TaxID=988480 RepID=A0A4P9YFW4_ROZAC|nr:hypothetical protein ROZALSC1DRAFT_30704 [Rozella allomycis CSF55]